MSEEIWKPVDETLGVYEVSNYGNVRRTNATHMRPGRATIKGVVNKMGYRIACLSVNGWTKAFNVHRLVALAFIGNPPDGMNTCNHKDANKQNNHVENLEWTTHQLNLIHAGRMGKMGRTRKLTQKQVNQILADSDSMIKDMAKLFNVTRYTIHDIRSRRTWKAKDSSKPCSANDVML